MSTPTKFSLGGVPRTRTGLVPTSFSQTAEKLATSQYYEHLPSQPKLSKYKYRGDYTNERNRKLSLERKISQKQQQPRSSVGSTLLVSPRSSINESVDEESTPINTQKWDSYCQHISGNKLSENEENSRLQNKKKYVSYLRSEATRRSPKKKEEKKDPVAATQRKPRVPRLSRLVRTGKKEKKHGPPLTAQAEGQADSKTDKKDAAAKPKVRYLEFISTKKTKDPPQSDHCDDKSDTSKPLVNSEEEDDESKFRRQIERIVDRAAKMCGSSDEDIDAADVVNTTKSSHGMIDKSTKNTVSKDGAPSNEKDNQLSNEQRVAILEEQVRSVTSSSNSVVTEFETHIGQSSLSFSTSTATEVEPRSQVKPMLWQQCFGQKSMVDVLHGIDSSLYTSSSYHTNTELDSTSGFTDMISSEGATIPVIDEKSVTEVQPRVPIHQSQAIEKQKLPSLDECPEINNISQVYPCAKPARENLFDNELLHPRGYENAQVCEDSLFSFDDIYPRTAESGSHLLDDLCSLLG